MQRLGSVIVFQEGVTEEEAAKALAKLADVIEMPTFGKPAIQSEMVRTFDDEWGGPVWYIP